MPDGLNLDGILGKEKLPGLSQLDPDFYEKAARLLQEFETEKNGAEPGSKKHEFLTDQLEVAKGQVREIIQERMRKIIRIASSQSVKRDSGDAPVLAQDELEFYNALLNLMTVWRRDRLEQVFGKRQVKKEAHAHTEPENQVQKTKNISGYVVCRLLRDVPTFVGADNRNYTLAKEDVAMVPGVNAKALIARKAAVQIAVK